MNENKVIGLVLTYYRKRANLSQKSLAELLEVTPARIWKWESGQTRIPLLHFIQICETLNITPSTFLKRYKAARFTTVLKVGI